MLEIKLQIFDAFFKILEILHDIKVGRLAIIKDKHLVYYRIINGKC